MDLGTFSLSLAVDDLIASRAFYETIGFAVVDGDEESWVMMANGDAKIGLFQQMFDSNIVTFNPPDARAVQAALADAGYPIDVAAEGDDGPAHCVVTDPDGNAVMFDQF